MGATAMGEKCTVQADALGVSTEHGAVLAGLTRNPALFEIDEVRRADGADAKPGSGSSSCQGTTSATPMAASAMP